MSQSDTDFLQEVADSDYKYGFVTDIEADTVPKGLNEAVIRLISEKKEEPEWMLERRLKAFRHWLTLQEKDKYPRWAHINYPDVDLKDWAYLYYKENYPRLQTAKKLWDPHNIFYHQQSIALP